MDMKRRILGVLLVLTLLLTMSACVNTARPSGSETTPSGENQGSVSGTIPEGVQDDHTPDPTEELSADRPEGNGGEPTVPQESMDGGTTAPQNPAGGGNTPPASGDSQTQKPSDQPGTTTQPTPNQPSGGNQSTDTPPAENKPQPTPEVKPPATYNHTPLAKSEYYHYAKLSGKEKQLYDQLTAAIESLENTVAVSGVQMKQADALRLANQVRADNPQYFWLSGSTTVFYDRATGNVSKILLSYSDGTKRDTFDKKGNPVTVADRAVIQQKRTQLNSKISQILASLQANLPQVDRELLIHDYIVKNVRYDYVTAGNLDANSLSHAYDIYGAAIEGLAVCEGYSKLFQYLCYCTGINATQISGVADGGPHMWNTVKLDGEWYQMDVTWNDTDNEWLYYKYFNLTDTEMGKNHTPDSDLSYPACRGVKYRYADYYALKLTGKTQVADNYKSVVDRLLKADGYIIIYTNGVQMDFNTVLYNDTAAIQQYAATKGYKLNFSRSYTTIDAFIYVNYTRQTV